MSGSKSFYVKTFAAKDSKHIFDPVIGVLLKSLKTDFTSSELSAFKKALRKEEVSLDILRLAAKIGIVEKRTMLKNQIALWSPVKALEFAMKYFDEKLYAEEIMPEFFKDEYVMKKIILAGRCKEYTKDSILGMLCGECDELVYGQKDLSTYFNEQPITNWIDVIKQYGMENVVKGFDTEFSLAINNFYKLSKSWDHLRVVSYKNKNSEQSELIPKDNNELFEIFGGNYDLIPRNIDEKEIEDNKDAEILVTNNKLYNSYSAGRQKVVRAYLGQNIRKLNEAIKSSSSIIFSAFDSYNGTPEARIENTIKESMSGGYYTNTDNLTSLHKQIKTAIQNSVFRTVAECVDFVVHKYIPIMKQAKKTNAFNNLNETKIGSIGMQVFAGGNRILNDSIDYEPVLDTDLLPIESEPSEPVVVEKIVEKPVIIEKVVEKVVEKPVIVEKAIQSTPVYYNFRGGAKNEHNSAKKLIQKLVAIQTDFNDKFMTQYRKIIKFLADVKSEDVSNDNINLLTFNSIDRILIKANKTAYKISGVIEGKSFNKEYCELLEATAQKIQKSKAFGHLSQILREMIKICESTRKQIIAARNEYMVSDKERYDTMEIELSEVKIPFDIKQEEIASLHDNFGRITMVIQERGNKAIKTQTETILTKYIKTRDEKEKMIEEYFDRPMKTYESYLTKYDRLKPLYNMRSIIQKQYKKSYLWLNKTLDVMLAKNRLEQLKSKTLTKQVIDRISKNKIQFNPLERKEEIHKLNTKLATDSTKREYFTSYFKIHNLCVRIINAYGVLDFMELLYKELEIVGKDFNWGEFKKGFMDYLVTMMIGIDVFQQGGNNQYAFRLIGTENTLVGETGVDINSDLSDLTQGVAASVPHFKKYVVKACDIFGINESALTGVLHDQHGHITGAPKSYAAGFIKSVYDMVAVTNASHYREAFGFSIRRVPGRDYIPKDFNMSEFSIKALYLPVLQVFDRFMKQRAGKDDMAFGNVDRLMMGGFEDDEEKELEAGAIMDMIEPEDEDFVIIPEASKFYLVAFAIVKHYSVIFNEQRPAEKQFKPSKLSPLAIVKVLEEGNQYEPKVDDIHFEQSIKAFNKYWAASNKSFDKAYELLITDLNASLIFDQFGDDKDTFMKTLPRQVQEIFTTIIQTVNDFKNTEFVKDYIEKYLNSSVDKMIKAKPETRKGLFKKILNNKEEKTDKEFVIFCETVLTPMYMCRQYYINMLCKFIIDMAGTNLQRADILPILSSVIPQENYYKFNNMFTSSSLVLAHPEIIAENMTPSQVFEFLKKKYIDDMTKIINVALRYPTIDEAKIKALKDDLIDQYISIVRETTSADLALGIRIDQPIKDFFEYNKFMPSYCNTYAVGDGSHYPNKFIHYCYDNTFGFNPADFKMENYYMNEAMKESTLTRYVCMCLAEYTPNYYIPTSFLEALLETRLHGSVFRDINPIPKTNRPQVNNDQKLDLPTELANCDKYLSLMVHISRSENAKSTCSSLTLSDNCIANLCSAIPFLINVLKQYSVVCKDFTYCLGSTTIPAKEEASELITLLKQLYNELYKTSKKIQFGETVSGFENNGYFTTFIAKEGMNENEYKNFAGKFCRLGLTPTIHNWMNRFTCQDVNYVNYNEFASYETEILNKIDDTYFTNGFKTIVIPILADLHFRTMASHINSYTHYNAGAGNVMLGGDVMPAKTNFFDEITKRKERDADDSNVVVRQLLLNAGIILENVTTYANTLTIETIGDNLLKNKIKDDTDTKEVLGTDYEHKDTGTEFKASFARFFLGDVIRTMVDYHKKNKSIIRDVILRYMNKHPEITSVIDDKVRDNVVEICAVVNRIGIDDKTEIKDNSSKSIFNTEYTALTYNGSDDTNRLMSTLNFISKLYVATENIKDVPKCMQTFYIIVNSVFPDMTIEAIENNGNPFIDAWSIITRAALKKINENSAMIDDTYESVAGNHVMLATLDNRVNGIEVKDSKVFEVTDMEADRNAFKYILEMEAGFTTKRVIYDDIAEKMAKYSDLSIGQTRRTELEREIINLVLLHEDDLWNTNLEYKSFLRYGTNLHNENLLYACSNVLGTDDGTKNTSKLFSSNNGFKLQLVHNDCLKSIARPNKIFFNDNGSLGPIIRTIQLGHALGDIPLNFDVSRQSHWLQKKQYADDSIFDLWLKKNKDKHYTLGEIKKIKEQELTIEYQSLIEDSLSTLYNLEYELPLETKAVLREIENITKTTEKTFYDIFGFDDVGENTIETKSDYITQNSLILNKALLEKKIYGGADTKISTLLKEINFGIRFLPVANKDSGKYDETKHKLTMEKVFAPIDVTTNDATKFNSMYHHVIDIDELVEAYKLCVLIRSCGIPVLVKHPEYSKYFVNALTAEEQKKDKRIISGEIADSEDGTYAFRPSTTGCDFRASEKTDNFNENTAKGISPALIKTAYEAIVNKETFVDFEHLITEELIGKVGTEGKSPAYIWESEIEKVWTAVTEIKADYKLAPKEFVDLALRRFEAMEKQFRENAVLIYRANIQAILFGNILNNYEKDAKFFNFGYEQQNKFDNLRLTLPNDKEIKVRIPKIKVSYGKSELLFYNYNTIIRANYGYKAMQQYTKLTRQSSMDKDGKNADAVENLLLGIVQDLKTLNPLLFDLLHDTIMMIDNNQDLSDFVYTEHLTMDKTIVNKLFPSGEAELTNLYDDDDEHKTIADKRLVAMYIFLDMITKPKKGNNNESHELFRVSSEQYIKLAGSRYNPITSTINFTEALPLATSIPSYCNQEKILQKYKKDDKFKTFKEKPDVLIPEIHKYFRKLYNIKDNSIYNTNVYLDTINKLFVSSGDKLTAAKGTIHKISDASYLPDDSEIKVDIINPEKAEGDTEVTTVSDLQLLTSLGISTLLWCCVDGTNTKGKNKQNIYSEGATYITDTMTYSNPAYIKYITDEYELSRDHMDNNFKIFVSMLRKSLSTDVAKAIFSNDSIKKIYNNAIASQITPNMKNKYRMIMECKDQKELEHNLIQSRYMIDANSKFDTTGFDYINSKVLGLPLRTRLNYSKHFVGTAENLNIIKQNYDINTNVLCETYGVTSSLLKDYDFKEDKEPIVGYYAYDLKDCGLSIGTIIRITDYKYDTELGPLIKPIKKDNSANILSITNGADLKIVERDSKVKEDKFLIAMKKYINPHKYLFRFKNEVATQIKNTTFKEKIEAIVSKLKGLFTFDTSKSRTIDRNQKKINKAMFGGFSLVSGKGEDIIKHIYGNQEEQILSTFLDKPINVADVDKQILSYFKNSMLTLTPAFDRHMFMEILYNAKLFDTAIAGIHTYIDADPAPDHDNVNIATAENTIRDDFGIMKKRADKINLYAASENEVANKEFNAANAYNGTTFETIFGDLYKQIDLIDRYNGASYHIIGYLKNLEYYDPVADERLKYVPERESRLDQF